MFCFVQIRLFPFACVFLYLATSMSHASEIQYYPAELSEQLYSAFIAKGISYKPRTGNVLKNGQPAYINQLILEDSPYLIQHAHNPVHWHSWGNEAFAKAKRENKPVFLSIGYSTCHWCHVMEEESFDNPDIAEVLNKYFISIKVDRESRPDVDAVYMQAVTLLTGRGGWPMSNFLTTEGKTFLGDSYFPPEPFKKLLLRVNEVWHHQQALVLKRADEVADAVASSQQTSHQSQTLDLELLQQATKQLIDSQDLEYGGFGQNMKFPNELLLSFLLEAYQRFDDTQALLVVEKSLQAMGQGGIYDQVGGGFHRYATDRKWLIPHFEKMLYNQAQLTDVYLQTYQLTGKVEYARIAKQTLDYVINDMQAEKEGFYSATDADSNGKEGEYFVWTPSQIKQALSPEFAERAMDLYGVTAQGNFEGHSILFLPISLENYAQKHNISLEKLLSEVEQIRTGLKRFRKQRVAPLLDDKIVTAWNAMMLESLVLASEVVKDPQYLEVAEKTAYWLWNNNRQVSGELWRIHWQGHSSISGNQQDYAFFASALLKLYDTTGDEQWLKKTQFVADTMIKLFWDGKQSGFFMNTTSETESMMVRPKDINDNAMPSANAVATTVLAQLSKRVANLDYTKKSSATFAAFSTKIKQSPTSFTRFLSAAALLNHAEMGTTQYAAKGAVIIRAKRSEKNKVVVSIHIKPGWHINAHEPFQKDLIATKINLENGAFEQVLYPPAIVKKLGFGKQKLALYENLSTITAILPNNLKNKSHFSILLQIQACNDKHCLAPETVKVVVTK